MVLIINARIQESGKNFFASGISSPSEVLIWLLPETVCWFCQTDYIMAYVNLSSQNLGKYEKHGSQMFLEGSL